jgi:hypothetical protein
MQHHARSAERCQSFVTSYTLKNVQKELQTKAKTKTTTPPAMAQTGHIPQRTQPYYDFELEKK